MSLNGQLWVEIVLRKKQIENIPAEFTPVIDMYKQFESDERLVLDVPRDWSGLRDGTVNAMLHAFNESMYLALAYVTEDRDEIVVDFDCNSVDAYNTIINGRKVVKYVKKRLRIVHILDAINNVFEVNSYELDMRYSEPIVNVLTVYSGSPTSGVLLNQFVRSYSEDK